MLSALIRLYSRWNYSDTMSIEYQIKWHFNLHVHFIRKTWNLFYNIHNDDNGCGLESSLSSFRFVLANFICLACDFFLCLVRSADKSVELIEIYSIRFFRTHKYTTNGLVFFWWGVFSSIYTKQLGKIQSRILLFSHSTENDWLLYHTLIHTDTQTPAP